MTPRKTAVTLGALVALTFTQIACGPTSFTDFCEQSTASSCKALIRCGGTALYANQSECETSLAAKANCSAYDGVKCSVDSAKASQCLSDIEKVECSSNQRPASCSSLTCATTTTSELSCRQISGGATSGSSGSSCRNTKSECTDGAEYQISVDTKAVLSCIKSGTTEKTVDGAGFCSKTSAEQNAAFKTVCGWAFP